MECQAQGTIKKTDLSAEESGRPPTKGTARQSRFGAGYTVILRGGSAVLHLLSDYYTDAVLEAAIGEDLEPLGVRGHTTSIPLFLGDLYVGEVNFPPNGNQRTVKAIREKCKKLHCRERLRSLTHTVNAAGHSPGDRRQGSREGQAGKNV